MNIVAKMLCCYDHHIIIEQANISPALETYVAPIHWEACLHYYMSNDHVDL